MNFKVFLELAKETYAEWSEDKASRLAAAFSYYTIFSMAPLLIILIAIAGFIFGSAADAQGKITSELQNAIGAEAARALEAMVQAAGDKQKSGVVATIVGVATLLYAAAGLFGQLQDALNTIWEVAPKPGQGLMAVLKQRFLSFSMVLGTGFILVVSLALSAAISALSTFMNQWLPMPEFVLQAVNFLVSLLITTLLFAAIYKVLPDVEIQWRDVWIGAALTALLLGVGRIVLGLYLGKSGVTSAYGAAGSLILILLWINYSAQILFFGAEFTQVYANKFGSHLKPAPNAVPVTAEARAQQGMVNEADLSAENRTEMWAPGVANVAGAPAAKTARGGLDKGDVDFISALMMGFAAVLFFASRRRRHDE